MPGACVSLANSRPAAPAAIRRRRRSAAIQRDITNNLYITDIGIRRDTGAAAFRWTPTDAWDINVDYCHMHRHGTQVEGVVFSPGTSGVAAQVPKPVDDTTQNFGINGEYKGTSPWGKNFTFKVGYAGSILSGRPGIPTRCRIRSAPPAPVPANARGGNGSPSSPLALMTLWPDNQANGFNATTRRGSADEEPLHGYRRLHHDAAKSGIRTHASARSSSRNAG